MEKNHINVFTIVNLMDSLIKYNLDILIRNISTKYDIPTAELNKLLDKLKLKLSNRNDVYPHKLPIYIDKNLNRYAILQNTDTGDVFFNAILIN